MFRFAGYCEDFRTEGMVLPRRKQRLRRRLLLARVFLALLTAGLAAGRPIAAPSPTFEFDIPYQLRVLPGGTVIELSGSFSWGLPQSLQALLASEPNVRVLQLESPGGQVQAALQVASMAQERGLNTYVGHVCASACTIAFLGGHQRWLGPDGRLGFHLGRGPGVAPQLVAEYMRQAYEKYAVPPRFIAHVLRTPPESLWFPTPEELRAIHYTTGPPPATVVEPHDNRLPGRDDRSTPPSA